MPFKSDFCNKRDGKPLSTYRSEHEAIEGADHARFYYGIDLLPYKCKRCGCWHLTPVERHTPSKTCVYCPDSRGRPKELYKTREDAERRAEIIAKEQGILLRVYPCDYQAGWHLTKNLKKKRKIPAYAGINFYSR
jgi:hypothetical protein